MWFANAGVVVVVAGEGIIVDDETTIWLSVPVAGTPVSEAGPSDVTFDRDDIHRLYQDPQMEVIGREELPSFSVDVGGIVLVDGIFLLVLAGSVGAKSDDGSIEIFTHFMSSSSL